MRLLFSWHLSTVVLRSVTSFIPYHQSALSATSQEQNKQRVNVAGLRSGQTVPQLIWTSLETGVTQIGLESPDFPQTSFPVVSLVSPLGYRYWEISNSEGQSVFEHLAASCSYSPLSQVYPWILAPRLEQSWKGLLGSKGHLAVFYGLIAFVCKGSLAWGLLLLG